MIKRLLLALGALSLLYAPACRGQQGGCGVSAEYFQSRIRYPGGPTSIVVPSSFPAAAIDTCGHFAFYYEDLRIAGLGGPAAGFADAARGAALRANMCDVVSYIEKVFDLNGIPSTAKIRIYVDTSLSAALKPLPDTVGWGYDYGVGSAYYDGTPGSGVISGFVEKFIKTGTDPVPGDYHGTLQMNLFHSLGWPPVLSTGRSYADWYDWSNYYVGTGAAKLCEPGFFQRALHVMGHVLGFAAFHSGLSHHGPGTGSTLFTVLEDSLYSGGDPLTTPAFFSSFTKGRTSTGLKAQLWVNNKANPGNYPFWDMHLEDASFYRPRMSPGDYQPNVMGQVNDWGVMKREFTKGDLEVFINRIGLPANPATFSSSGTYAALFANHVPTSDRMASMAMSIALNEGASPEYLPTDYTLVNNTGASLSIDLTTLTADLRDDDGDPITIMDGSLVNLRGCGSGGNNHDLLTVNAAKNVITYTPREDYYGRSQFAFNLWDGKEKGAYVIFTIDVLKGSAVSVPKGDNIVLNGDFEEGSEVRLPGNSVNNYCNNPYGIGKTGRLLGGHHFADAHPYDCYTHPEGNAIRNSYADCAVVDAGFGNPFTSFPWMGGGVAFGDPSVGSVGAPDFSPDAYFPGGVTKNDRYMILSPRGALLYLASPLKQCKQYRIEYDIRHRFSPAEWTSYTPNTPVHIGFTDSSKLIDVQTIVPGASLGLLTYNQSLPVHYLSGITNTAWKHDTLYFTYCSADSSDIMYFNVLGQGGGGAVELADNISIVEVDEIPVSVTITQEQLSRCATKLIASDIINGCEGIRFEWRVKGTGTIIATGREYTPPSPNLPTTYEVTVFDGCHTAKGEVELKPCRCSAGAVFGEPSANITGSTYAATTLPAGYYYLDHDITVTSNCTFSDAKILIEPGVTITVANDKKLIIERSHLLVCPDTNALWKGIVLANGGPEGSSARIEVRDSSLIEDAETAIKALSPASVFAGDVIVSTNSVYNRNLLGIYIDNYKRSDAPTYPFRFTGNVFTARRFSSSSYAGYPNAWPGPAALSAKGPVVSGQTNELLHQQYEKALCKNGVFSNAGISLNEVGAGPGGTYYEIAVGGAEAPNLFDNMGFGIRMNNTNLASYNNRFTNISMLMKPVPRGTAPAYVYDASAGIFSYCSSPLSNYRLRVLPLVQGGGNTFHDCFTGILAINQAELEVNGAGITSSHTLGYSVVPGAAYTDQFYEGEGIKVIGNQNQRSVKLSYNNISNMNEGIYLYLNNPGEGATMEISNNSLFAANPDPLYAGMGDQYMLQAIEVFAPWEARNSTLRIRGNTFDRVYNAVLVNNLWLTRATVSNNTIRLRDKTMSTTGTPQYGIQMLQGWAATVHSNTISTPGLGTAAQADYIKGVYAAFTRGLTVCNNAVSNIGRSFEFSQTTPQPWTVWAGNTMSNAWKGFVLGSPIGDQLTVSGTNRPAGNKWLGAWSAAKPNTFATVSSSTSKLNVRSGAAFAEYPNFNNASAAGLQYTATSPASILTPNTSVYTCSPTAAPLTGSGGLLAAVLGDAMGADIPAANVWMAQYGLYKTAAFNEAVQDGSLPALQTFIDAAAGSRYAWLTAIETALGSGNTIEARQLLDNPVAAMGRVAVDEGNEPVVVADVPEADAVVANYIHYYGLYLRFLDSTMSGNDTAELERLALQCPATDGAAVYQARGLLRLLTGIVAEYKDQDCAEQGQYRIAPYAETEGGQQAYTLYPNPNKGSFTILQNVAEDKTVRIKVYNALGAQVYQSYSTFKAGKLNINAGQQAPGLYLVCLDNTCLRFVIR